MSTDALTSIKDWDAEYGRRDVPVLVDAERRDADEIDQGDAVEFTDGGPFLSGKHGDLDRFAMIRIHARPWAGIKLERVTVHPRAAEITRFPAPEQTTLEFPPPQCPYCEIDLYHDGDSWQCEMCRSWWSSDGHGAHRRACVEQECDGAEADVVGDDGQPRCRSCQFLVVLEVIEPSGPYQCSEPHCYSGKVTGMPAGSPARRNGLGRAPRCGRCQQRVSSDAWWANYRREHPAVVSAESL